MMMLPLLLVTCTLILFSSFLTIASFCLGYRGSRDWMEYATTTLLAILVFLLPMLSVEIAVVSYLKGACTINWVFAPWTAWLSGLVLFAVWQSFTPLKPASLPQLDRLPNRYRRGHDLHSDTEMLLPQP